MPQRRKRLKIAVVGRVDASAIDGLQDLPGDARLSTWDDIYADFDAIRDYAPDVLTIDGEALRSGDLGVLRLLRASCAEDVITVVAIPRPREFEFLDLVRRAEARLLPTPCAPREVAIALGVDGTGGKQGQERGPVRPSPSTFFDIARGVADEINNPILFVAGHLELIESSLDREADADRLVQCAAIRQGLDRIAATMDKIKRLGDIRELEPPFGHTPFAELDQQVLQNATPSPALERFALEVDASTLSLEVRGQRETLAEALRQFLGVTLDLARISDRCVLKVDTLDRDLRLRASLHGERFAQWEGPRTFEPYYLSRVLRGSPHGLALFLVQAVVSAHGGRAIATRRPDGELRLELHLKCG